MNTPADFHLSKWYLDCVGDNGDTLIAYSADLKWKALTLHYSSILHVSKDTGAHTKTSLVKNPHPQIRDASIRWASQALNIEGIWNSLAPPIQRDLCRAADGSGIRWSCLQPRAEVEVQVGNQRIKGIGYADRVEMTVAPWELPIRELRWGRFHSSGQTLVWVDLRGEAPQTLLFLNGEFIANGVITDHEVRIHENQTVLTLENNFVLRDGPIMSTALSMIPGITLIIPEKLSSANECKWLSDGCLKKAGAPPMPGKAIHEVVTFA